MERRSSSIPTPLIADLIYRVEQLKQQGPHNQQEPWTQAGWDAYCRVEDAHDALVEKLGWTLTKAGGAA
jgi:hypothetical protein